VLDESVTVVNVDDERVSETRPPPPPEQRTVHKWHKLSIEVPSQLE
jgi:hypothetical protein